VRCGERALRVVVDTNVWVSGLIVPRSAPGRVLRAVRGGEIDVVISWELAAELRDVLDRPKLATYDLADEDVRDLLSLTARDLPTVHIEVDVRDVDDVPVMAAAVGGRANVIVTGDRDLLDDAELRGWLAERGVEVLTPVELVARL
jgi:uncharacterized protein